MGLTEDDEFVWEKHWQICRSKET